MRKISVGVLAGASVLATVAVGATSGVAWGANNPNDVTVTAVADGNKVTMTFTNSHPAGDGVGCNYGVHEDPHLPEPGSSATSGAVQSDAAISVLKQQSVVREFELPDGSYHVAWLCEGLDSTGVTRYTYWGTEPPLNIVHPVTNEIVPPTAQLIPLVIDTTTPPPNPPEQNCFGSVCLP